MPSCCRLYARVFSKINALSNDTALPSRSRFMYKDLLILCQPEVPRARRRNKTLEEIRKDVEIEERKQQQHSRGGGGGGGRGATSRNSGDVRDASSRSLSSNRPRQPKQVPTLTQTDSRLSVSPVAPFPHPKAKPGNQLNLARRLLWQRSLFRWC
jgi:hypothetical protein